MNENMIQQFMLNTVVYHIKFIVIQSINFSNTLSTQYNTPNILRTLREQVRGISFKLFPSQ